MRIVLQVHVFCGSILLSSAASHCYFPSRHLMQHYYTGTPCTDNNSAQVQVVGGFSMAMRESPASRDSWRRSGTPGRYSARWPLAQPCRHATPRRIKGNCDHGNRCFPLVHSPMTLDQLREETDVHSRLIGQNEGEITHHCG